jgi:hypothetical protein
MRTTARSVECFVDFSLVGLCLVAFVLSAAALEQPSTFSVYGYESQYYTLSSFYLTYSHTVRFYYFASIRVVLCSNFMHLLLAFKYGHVSLITDERFYPFCFADPRLLLGGGPNAQDPRLALHAVLRFVRHGDMSAGTHMFIA